MPSERPGPKRTKAGIRPLDVVGTVALAALAVLVCWAVRPHPYAGTDASVYLAIAHNVADFWKPLRPDDLLMTVRAPLYPTMAGVAIRLFGDPQGPELLRLAFVGALAVGTLALGYRWYGRVTAVVALALMFTSVRFVSVITVFSIDLPAAVFVVFAVFVVDIATRRPSVGLGAIGGALFALAILTKESSVLIVPIPLAVALVRAPKDGWTFARPLAAVYTVMVLGLLPWMVIALVAAGQLLFLSLGGALGFVVLLLVVVLTATAGVVVFAERGAGVWAAVERRAAAIPSPWPVIIGLSVFVLGALLPSISIARAFAHEGTVDHGPAELVTTLNQSFGELGGGWVIATVALVFLVVASIAGRRNELENLFLVLVYLPLVWAIVYFGYNGSLRTSLPAAVALLLAVARFIVAAAGAITRFARDARRHTGRRVPLSAALVVLLVVGSIVFIGRMSIIRVDAIAAAMRKPDTTPGHQIVAERIAGYLDSVADQDTVVMAGWRDWATIRRFSDGGYPVFQMPHRRVRPTAVGPPLEPYDFPDFIGYFGAVEVDDYGDDWILVRPHWEGYFVGLSQTALITALRDHNVSYLVVGNGGAPMSTPGITATLDQMPGLTRVHSDKSAGLESVVYAVDLGALSPVPDAPLMLDQTTFDSLTRRLAELRGITPADAAALLAPTEIIRVRSAHDRARPGAG